MCLILFMIIIYPQEMTFTLIIEKNLRGCAERKFAISLSSLAPPPREPIYPGYPGSLIIAGEEKSGFNRLRMRQIAPEFRGDSIQGFARSLHHPRARAPRAGSQLLLLLSTTFRINICTGPVIFLKCLSFLANTTGAPKKTYNS